MPAKKPTVDQILGKAKPRTTSAVLFLDQDLDRRHRELEQQLADALPGDGVRLTQEGSIADPPRSLVLAEQLRDLEAKSEHCRVTFTFRSIGHRGWADLRSKYPPTEQQAKQGRFDHDPDTFQPAALAACCVSHDWDIGDWRQFDESDKINSTQWDLLVAACYDANMGGGVAPKSLAAGIVQSLNGASGSTAAAGGSPAAFSSDES